MHWMDVFYLAAIVLLVFGSFSSWRAGVTVWPYWYPVSGTALLCFVVAEWFQAHGGGPVLFGGK